MSVVERLGVLTKKRGAMGAWYGFVIFFFAAFVIIPTVFVLSYVFTHWGDIETNVLSDPQLMSLVYHSFATSVEIAVIVTVIDFVAGLPLAWLLARGKFRGRGLLDTLVDMPLVVPTAALGFSTALFWAQISPDKGLIAPFGSLGLVSSPFIMVVLLHVAFSFPYMVRSLKAAIEEVDISYETAASTLGAAPFTVWRMITMPLFRAGLATGVVLCMARSLSETGATFIAYDMLYSFDFGAFQLGSISTGMNLNSPALIQILKKGKIGNLEPTLAFISALLILIAVVLLVITQFIAVRLKFPIRKVWPRWEKLLSRGWTPRVKDGAALLFFAFIIIVPSFFIFSYLFTVSPGGVDWPAFWASLSISFLVAVVVMLINLAMGMPMAILIARGRNRAVVRTLDTLTNLPIIIPTVALGFSLGLFWRGLLPGAPDILLIVFAHVAFTYPFIVRTAAASMMETDASYEETGRTLGANRLQVFRRILFPLIKPSILAGAIMMFTRSLDETGATIAVLSSGSGTVTVPVYIVNLISAKTPNFPAAALACVALIAVSFAALLLIRFVTGKRARR